MSIFLEILVFAAIAFSVLAILSAYFRLHRAQVAEREAVLELPIREQAMYHAKQMVGSKAEVAALFCLLDSPSDIECLLRNEDQIFIEPNKSGQVILLMPENEVGLSAFAKQYKWRFPGVDLQWASCPPLSSSENLFDEAQQNHPLPKCTPLSDPSDPILHPETGLLKPDRASDFLRRFFHQPNLGAAGLILVLCRAVENLRCAEILRNDLRTSDLIGHLGEQTFFICVKGNELQVETCRGFLVDSMPEGTQIGSSIAGSINEMIQDAASDFDFEAP